MSLYQNKYRIETIRLPGCDYTRPGYYFVTICTEEHQCFFGDIVCGKMHLSDIGQIAQQYWAEIPDHFPGVELDEYIVMPHHLHGIIVKKTVGGSDVSGRDVALQRLYTSKISGMSPARNFRSKISPKPGSLGAIVRSYKAEVTKWCRKNEHDEFAWQERYYENIIREQVELENVRRYIRGNPARWSGGPMAWQCDGPGRTDRFGTSIGPGIDVALQRLYASKISNVSPGPVPNNGRVI
jgi:putative transposase